MRLALHASRSASSATSRPILWRYLKQSVTVLATPVTQTGTPSTTCSSTPSVSAAPDKCTRPSTPQCNFHAAPPGAVAQRRAGEVPETQRRVAQLRRGRLVVDGQPDRERGLRRQVMKTQ